MHYPSGIDKRDTRNNGDASRSANARVSAPDLQWMRIPTYPVQIRRGEASRRVVSPGIRTNTVLINTRITGRVAFVRAEFYEYHSARLHVDFQ